MQFTGYRESAFVSAILAAGVASQVSRACSQGRLVSCGCDPAINRKALTKSFRDSLERENRLVVDQMSNHIDESYQIRSLGKKKSASRWKWGGCSYNMDFGIEFSKIFLDAKEKSTGDIQSQINLHNNNAGRMVVLRNEIVRCKCHGMSGSCQLKTCWKSAPDFRVVGKALKLQFRRAIMVDQSNLGNGPIVMKSNRKRNRSNNGRRAVSSNSQPKGRRLETSLFYYQRSPNFCDLDQNSDIPGTMGRVCNQTSSGSDGCSSMCCGRGYNLVRERRIEKCNCKFHWCCFVECQECETEEWISVCK